MNTAKSWGVLLVHFSQDSEVSLLSPGWSPGVLKEPVVSSVVGSVADDEHSVIEAGSTESLHDTTVVELEQDGCSVNGNRDWAFSYSSSESRWTLLLNISEVFDLYETGLWFASSGSTFVWVLFFGIHRSGFSVGEGIVHETTVATHVSLGLGAVNELLLREGNEVSLSGDLVSTLHISSGREGPA